MQMIAETSRTVNEENGMTYGARVFGREKEFVIYMPGEYNDDEDCETGLHIAENVYLTELFRRDHYGSGRYLVR